MIVYKDVFGMLAAHGWSTYRLQKDNALSNSCITRLHNNQPISTETINLLCRLCDCQPEDLMQYVPDEE